MSGLEIASFALSVATKTEQLTESLVQGIRNAAQFGVDYEKFRLASNLEATTFRSIKRVLFGQMAEPSSNCLFAAFDRQTQVDIVNILRLFKDTLEAKYRIIDSDKTGAGLMSPSAQDVINDSISFGSYHSASLAKRLKWGFVGKAKVENTVRELHSWNEKLLNIIKIQMIENRTERLFSERNTSSGNPLPFVQLLQISGVGDEATNLGLESDLRLVDISYTESASNNFQDLQLRDNQIPAYAEVSWKDIKGSRRLAKANGSFALIEYKPFIKDKHFTGPSEPSRNRINQLVNILHEEKPGRYHSLTCKGFFIEDSQFALWFDIPSELSPEFQNLSAMLQGLKEPNLELRFILARELATALWQFHSVGWIHKSFCSANVLFFQKKDGHGAEASLSEPYLFGWEYSRPESGLSSRPYEEDDIVENVYRHPEQWGLPTTTFNRLHDIYSLGVVLLEVALWKPMIDLHRSKFRTLELGSDVMKYILDVAKHQRVSAAMGKRYQKVVISCLEGSISSSETQKQALDIEVFKAEVGFSSGCQITWLTVFLSGY